MANAARVNTPQLCCVASLMPRQLAAGLLTDGVLPLLPEERRKKAIRYRRPIDRKNCVITFLMLKTALKEEFQIVDFTLQYGKYGKPYLAEYPDIRFNISHCRCGCLVAVADCSIGADIQDIRLFSWEVAEKVCCKEERETLKQSTERDREFTRIWAMKESYIKMMGKGIGSDLTEINTLSKKYVHIIDRENSVIAVCIEQQGSLKIWG